MKAWEILGLSVCKKWESTLWREHQRYFWPTFAKEVKCVTHGFSQISQQESRMEMWLSTKVLGKTHLSKNLNLPELHASSTGFENFIVKEMLPVWAERDKEGIESRKNDPEGRATAAKDWRPPLGLRGQGCCRRRTRGEPACTCSRTIQNPSIWGFSNKY